MFRRGRLMVLALGVAVLSMLWIGSALAFPDGITPQKEHTVSPPTRVGTDVVKGQVKIDGVSKFLPQLEIEIDETIMKEEDDAKRALLKAQKYVQALNTRISFADGTHPIELHAEQKKDQNGNPTATVVVAASMTTVTVDDETGEVTQETENIEIKWLQSTKKPGNKGSGQKKKKWKTAGGKKASSSEIDVWGPASGYSLDSHAPIVQAGTARGMAVVSVTSGMSATEIRDDLVDDLRGLGIAATAVGPNRVVIEMDDADGDYVVWGSSDSEVEVACKLIAEDW